MLVIVCHNELLLHRRSAKRRWKNVSSRVG